MVFFLSSIHVLTCLFLILVVLLQQGKGADLSVFGGGSTMTAFGARGAASLLHKLTVTGFVLYIVTTLAIGVFQGRGGDATVMGDVPAVGETEPATADAESDIQQPELPEWDESVSAAEEETGAVEVPSVGETPESESPGEEGETP
ncbi:MAG: preprotein translocase subunit SecG [bacterium]|nr:preprotein translocase subunit SecG [bacterium]